jgi:hypothetical protein
MLARSIAVKCVWIDSLSILQDDSKDWQSEAKAMRDVYHNAAIVVAAADSRDYTQGLFIADRPHAIISEPPVQVNDVTRGSFFAALIPWSGEDRPERGPLYWRAWVLQEWYLAQRLITFMPGGMSWKCSAFQSDDIGQEATLSGFETMSWYHLLEKYCDKTMSYKSDRLYALSGIAEETQRTRDDLYRYEYGVWEDTSHGDLLWKQMAPVSESESLALPTWSWASIGGGK